MLTHLVCFKYKPDTSEAQRTDHLARLKRLASLGGVVDLKVGRDVVGSARSYDAGLVVLFPDRAALDAYSKDPQHLPVVQLAASLCDHIVAVDFEN